MPPFSLEILQRYCKLVILGTLGVHGYGHQKLWYPLQGNFDTYLHAKKISLTSFVPRYCKLVTLGTLRMPGHPH